MIISNRRFRGSRLVGRNYEPLPETTLPDGTLILHSQVLGLDIRLDRGRLRFYDPVTGQHLLTHLEAEQARRDAEQAQQAAEARVQQETAARQAVEARMAELEARLQVLQEERPSPPHDP